MAWMSITHLNRTTSEVRLQGYRPDIELCALFHHLRCHFKSVVDEVPL